MLGQSTRVGVVLYRQGNAEPGAERLHEVQPAPAADRIHAADHARERVHRPGAADAYSGQPSAKTALQVHKRGHHSDHVVYVLSGEMLCGDVLCKAGMHITLEKGAVFGPFIAGPEGVVLFEVMMGDPRSFAADPEGWKKLLASKNAKQLPNPPIDMPDWLVDTRSK